MTRAVEVLKSAKKPLIILGKGAAYAQADVTGGKGVVELTVDRADDPTAATAQNLRLWPETPIRCPSCHLV